MTIKQFDDWYDHHCSLFPSLRTWMSRKPHRQSILDQWKYLFDGIDMLDAKAASRRLWEAETRPRTYEDHPTWIARECRRQAKGRDQAQTFGRFGEQTYGCSTCCDSGIASIYVVGNLLRKGIEMHRADKVMNHVGTINCDCMEGLSRGRPNLDHSSMILSRSRSKGRLDENPELAQRRRAQVEAMVAKMENVDAGCPF